MTGSEAGDAIGARVLRKAGWRIIPLLGLAYMTAFMDRSNISFAAKTMNADLGFSETIYGIGGGIFFLSYALFEIPSNVILARVGARKWIARIMITWGLVAAGMLFVKTPMQFYAMRFLLGICEAGFFPGVILYLSQWFPKEARGRAISRFYISGPLTRVVLGTASVWLLSLDGVAGMKGWQWLFLVQGLPSVLVGLLVLALLPGDFRSVSWLDAREKAWLAGELEGQGTGQGVGQAAGQAAGQGGGHQHHLLAALRHPMVLLLGAIGLLTTATYYTFTLSEPRILASAIGLALPQVGYLVSFAGLLGAAAMLFTGWLSDRSGNRVRFLFVSTALVTLAYVGFAANLGPVPSLIAYLLYVSAWGSVTLSVWMVCTDMLPPRDMPVGTAMINTMSQVGAFLCPIAWGMAKDATGSFHAGFVGLVGLEILALVLILVLARNLARRRPA